MVGSYKNNLQKELKLLFLVIVSWSFAALEDNHGLLLLLRYG